MNCVFCEREINNKGSLASHQQVCSKNPNRIKHKRSPDTGAKKGAIPWNKGKRIGPHPVWRERFPNEKIFVEDSKYARRLIKIRILKDDLIEYVCGICGIGPEWNGQPMPLILDHENGINNDNRLDNLRFVCSNCDSQLPTYKSKNRGRVPESG